MENYWNYYSHRAFCLTWNTFSTTLRHCLHSSKIALKSATIGSAVVVLIALAPINRAVANGISVDPSFSQVELTQASPSATLRITIKNDTNEKEIFEIKPVDIQQVDTEGNVQLLEKPIEGNALAFAQYVKLSTNSLTLEPHTTQEVSITLQSSDALSPGGHYAAILFKGSAQMGSSGQRVIPALTTFVLVNKKGGELYHISLSQIKEFEKSVLFSIPENIRLQFNNAGNTHLTPHGVILIKDLFGRIVFKGIINEGSRIVLPGTDRILSTNIKQLRWGFPLMIYTVSIRGDTAPGDIVFNQESTVVLVSIYPLVGILALCFFCGYLFFRSKKRITRI